MEHDSSINIFIPVIPDLLASSLKHNRIKYYQQIRSTFHYEYFPSSYLLIFWFATSLYQTTLIFLLNSFSASSNTILGSASDILEAHNVCLSKTADLSKVQSV